MTWIVNVLLIIVTVGSILITRPFAEEYFIIARLNQIFGYHPVEKYMDQLRGEINFSNVNNYSEFQNFMTDTIGVSVFTSGSDSNLEFIVDGIPAGKMNIRT